MATHYDLLGVRPDAGVDEIQQAYRRLARRHHPDVQPDGDRATMAAINGAWQVLRDPALRRSYDRLIDTPPPQPARPAPPPASGWQPLPWDTDDDLDPEDLSDEPLSPPMRGPADLLVMTPVLLFLAAVAIFFFSMMSGSNALRSFAMLLVPLSGFGFVIAPLFVMVRSRSRSQD